VRLSLEFQVVPSSGGELAEPTYWPVYFAADDRALRTLSGDVVSDWLVAPGALGKSELPSWLAEIADSGLGGGSYVGYGLVYSDGTGDDAAQAYQDLLATLHAVVIRSASGATGLDALLGMFGAGRGKPIQLDSLREGLDPAELAKELGEDLVTGVAAFRSVGDALLPFTQGVPLAAPPPPPPRKVAAPVATHPPISPVLHIPSGPPSVPIARPPVHLPTARAFAPGTVVAVTVQAVRLDDLARKGAIGLDRELPARVSLKASPKLAGKLSRQDQLK
jgi:hypothetical protein